MIIRPGSIVVRRDPEDSFEELFDDGPAQEIVGMVLGLTTDKSYPGDLLYEVVWADDLSRTGEFPDDIRIVIGSRRRNWKRGWWRSHRDTTGE